MTAGSRRPGPAPLRPALIGAAILPFLLAGCMAGMQRGGSAAELRAAQDVPPQFVTPDGTTPEDGCRTTLLDPRDQATLRLVRSARFGLSYHGDYDVPAGRYGVEANELLRVDCATGEVVGIVVRS